MIKRIVSFALHQPLFLIMLVVLFVAAGVVAFRSLPVEAFPDLTYVQTNGITLFPGHAPEEVEKQITIPLEIALAGVPHSVRMFSHTQFGLSFLTLTFDDQVDDYFARQRVLERLQDADVVSRGGFIKQYEVGVDPVRMRAYGVTLQQVFTALGRGNANAGGNYLEQGQQQYLIRGIGLLRSPDEIGSIVVAEHG